MSAAHSALNESYVQCCRRNGGFPQCHLAPPIRQGVSQLGPSRQMAEGLTAATRKLLSSLLQVPQALGAAHASSMRST